MIWKLALGAILGGLILFGWSAVSHMWLPIYEDSLLPFSNEDAVKESVVGNAPSSGVYFLPYIDMEGMSEEEQQAVMDEAMQGPVVFATVRLGPARSFGSLLVTEILADMLAALVATALLFQLRPLSYARRVLFVIALGLVVVLAATVSAWNWYNFSPGFTAAETLDHVVGWGLVGLVLARIVRPTAQRTAA